MSRPTFFPPATAKRVPPEAIKKSLALIDAQSKNGLNIEALNGVNPIVRARILLEHGEQKAGLEDIYRFSSHNDWDLLTSLFYFFFVEHKFYNSADFIDFWVGLSSHEKEIFSDQFKGIVTSTLLASLKIQDDVEQIAGLSQYFLEQHLFPFQSPRTDSSWDGFSETQFESYNKKHGPRLSALYRDMLSEIKNHEAHAGSHVDLGCGSGILGKVFRDFSTHIVGVEQSKEFLSFSESVYDDVVVSNIQTFTDDCADKYDFATLGGVAQYFYYLDELFFRVSGILKGQGLFAFNTIDTEIEGAPAVPSGPIAIAHDPEHVKNCLRNCGFEVLGYFSKNYWPEHSSSVFICRKI